MSGHRNFDYFLRTPRLFPVSASPHTSVARRTPREARDLRDTTAPRASQIDLWPQRVFVDELDARAVAGAQTRVTAMYKVRYEREPGVHQVFLDHHGSYCAEHGPGCKAVREVTAHRDPLPSTCTSPGGS